MVAAESAMLLSLQPTSLCFSFRDLVEVVRWACLRDWVQCLLLDICHQWAHPGYCQYRGKHHSKKKSTNHLHHGRQHQEALLALWMKPFCFSPHLQLLMPKLQSTGDLCQSLQKNGNAGYLLILHLSVRVIIIMRPQLFTFLPRAGHSHLRNQPSMGHPSDLPSLLGPVLGKWHKASVQQSALLCTVHFSEVNRWSQISEKEK